jgi:hypothetical protein
MTLQQQEGGGGNVGAHLAELGETVHDEGGLAEAFADLPLG